MSAPTKSGVKHPDNMKRKEKLAMIRALPEKEAVKFWLTHCPRISRKSFSEARSNG